MHTLKRKKIHPTRHPQADKLQVLHSRYNRLSGEFLNKWWDAVVDSDHFYISFYNDLFNKAIAHRELCKKLLSRPYLLGLSKVSILPHILKVQRIRSARKLQTPILKKEWCNEYNYQFLNPKM